jgi:hypothetical protein
MAKRTKESLPLVANGCVYFYYNGNTPQKSQSNTLPFPLRPRFVVVFEYFVFLIGSFCLFCSKREKENKRIFKRFLCLLLSPEGQCNTSRGPRTKMKEKA